MINNLDVVIIGAGPSGIAAAIYLKRANKNIILLEKESIGGQIINTSIIENYPGFIKIDGATLALKMYEQIEQLNINIKYGNVFRVETIEDNYKVITDKEEYITKKVIIATGRSPKQLNVENINKYLGKGVSYCATCDGYLYKNMDVAVIGAGDSAYEESLYLSNICKKVYILNRGNNIKAGALLETEVNNKENIEIYKNTIVESLIEKDNKLIGIKTNNGTISLSAIFIFIGQKPNKINVENLKTENDYIIVNDQMETNLEGIYAVGDIIKKDYYQITLAVGEGTKAALDIIKKLNC